MRAPNFTVRAGDTKDFPIDLEICQPPLVAPLSSERTSLARAAATSALLLFVLLAGVQLADLILGTVELVGLVCAHVCARLRDADGLTGWLADGRRLLEGEQPELE
ncbi:hypothetical protein T492DRAFT_896549 [Pavlovales sp. CCMP2436]|nr:hypothetical protein T492DRAFT_896549 [Pavlovales sp. CCMP2436]